MKLDKRYPQGYDAYIVKRTWSDKQWAKKMKGKAKDAKKNGI